MRWSIFKNRFVIVFICLVAGYFASKIPGRITLCKTKSVQYCVYWTMPYNTDSQITLENKYIRAILDIDLPNTDCKPCQIVKRVGCDSLSLVQVKNKTFYCDGNPIGEAFRDDFIAADGIIPEDKVFLIGDHQSSYDSRYFGLVEKSKINATLLPLF